MWVVILLLAVAVAYLIWQKLAPPKPPPRVVQATPVPVTPPPATPEPVIVKATPTPTPTPAPVVMATPTPTPTPPPLDMTMVARAPGLWPKQISLVQPINFPVVLNGRVVGQAMAPVGTVLRVLRVGAQQVEVEYQNNRQVVPVASTDLYQKALATFRANGSVIPEAPVVAAATPSATPPPPPDVLKVEVSTDRKRTDVGRAGPVSAGDEVKSSEKYVYAIKVQNREFGDVPPLDVQYVVFVERQKLGEKKDKDTIERVNGTLKTEALTRKVPAQTISTSEIELFKQSLVGNFHYANGGRTRVEDNIVGVWVKVLHEGKVIAESTTPSTVTKRGWEPK